jgi:hypothetical protein
MDISAVAPEKGNHYGSVSDRKRSSESYYRCRIHQPYPYEVVANIIYIDPQFVTAYIYFPLPSEEIHDCLLSFVSG